MLKRTFEGVFLPPQARKSRISHPETCCLQQMWAPIPQAAEGWEQVSKRGLQQHIPLTLWLQKAAWQAANSRSTGAHQGGKCLETFRTSHSSHGWITFATTGMLLFQQTWKLKWKWRLTIIFRQEPPRPPTLKHLCSVILKSYCVRSSSLSEGIAGWPLWHHSARIPSAQSWWGRKRIKKSL